MKWYWYIPVILFSGIFVIFWISPYIFGWEYAPAPIIMLSGIWTGIVIGFMADDEDVNVK